MSSFYTIRKYSDLCKLGRSHYTDNPAKDTLFDESEYDKINKIKLPKIFDKIYKILSDWEVLKHEHKKNLENQQ